MNRNFATIMVFALVLVGGCAAPKKLDTSIQIYGYSFAGVEVTISEDAYTGLFERADNIDDAEFAEQVKEQLETIMTEMLASSFSGTMPAIIDVHVDEINIASAVGRAMIGSKSFIGAKVRVVDAATRSVIAEKHFRERERDIDFSGNIGALIEITKNIIDAVANDRVEEVVREFTEAVKEWLDS